MIGTRCQRAALALLTTLAIPGWAETPPAVQPAIQVIQPLSFGGLLVSPRGGSITLTADGVLVPDGPGIQPGATPPAEAARFRLTGPPGARFSLQVDPRVPMLTSPQGGQVRLVQFDPAMDAFGTFDSLGAAEFKLGGRLEVGAGTPPGWFRATQVKLQMNVAGVRGAETVNASFSISALIRAPLRLINHSPLSFGGLIPGDGSGTFEVLAGGGHQSRGTGAPILVKGEPSPAAFFLQGPEGVPYTIQLPTRIILTGPGTPLLVDELTCSAPLTGTLPPVGLPFSVGGRLGVPPGQALGEYRGVFTVTVSYP